MANNKTGFIYYNVDTDRYLDSKIRRLKKNFGCSGIAIYDFILCEVYRDKGCFLQWDESTAFNVAEYFVIKETLVNEVVNYCGVVGLFNKELLSGGIITSFSIQKRALEMAKWAKRINYVIPKKIKIQEESTEITEESMIIQEESNEIPEGLGTERKKEKKENTLYASEEILINNFSLSYDELLHEFLISQNWQETLVMTEPRFKTVENVKSLMKMFCLTLKKADQFPISMKEAKNRFGGWVNRNANFEQTQQQPQRMSGKYL